MNSTLTIEQLLSKLIEWSNMTSHDVLSETLSGSK